MARKRELNERKHELNEKDKQLARRPDEENGRKNRVTEFSNQRARSKRNKTLIQ